MTAVIDPPILLAPVAPGDGPALDAFFALCSPQARYTRFFAPLHALPADYRAGALAGDPARHDALIAAPYGPHGPLVGLASLVTVPGPVGSGRLGEAELGVLVADDWQRRGIGTALVDQLVARARQRGVRYLRATVLPTSNRLLGWLGRSLPLEHSEWDGSSATGRFRLL
jgi:GNAT superfamily N-acetyltransferase